MSRPSLLERADLIAWVDEARRAPSVHNIQPARWALREPGTLELSADPSRTLPVADPSGHDVRISLGAAWEGMAIALSRRGLTAGPPQFTGDLASSAAPVARCSIERGGDIDPLASHVSRRATYRGTFAATACEPLDALERQLAPFDVTVVRGRKHIQELAALADEASDGFLEQPGYWSETWAWLRMTPSHPGWPRDGLNADALALSGIERAAAQFLMAPAAFEWMRRFGLARARLSERPKTSSAGAMLLFTAALDEDPFITGRAFYRCWLEVTAAGLSLCPMSVLADSKRTNTHIRDVFRIREGRRLVNVLRVGAAPAGFPSRLTPRLPVEELIAH